MEEGQTGQEGSEGQATSVAEIPDTGAEGGAASQPKTFTQEQVEKIVQDRVKGWQKYGRPEEIEQRLGRLNQLEQWSQQVRSFPGQNPGQTATAPLTDEDKKVQAYLERINPGWSKANDNVKQMQQQLQELDKARWTEVANRNEGQLKEWAKTAGYKDDHMSEISNRVAQSIMGNPQDYQAYVRGQGDASIVKKHFDALDKWMKSFSPAPAAAANATYAQNKAKTSNLPPRMPAAGTSGATEVKKKMSDKDRVDAAFAAFTKQ